LPGGRERIPLQEEPGAEVAHLQGLKVMELVVRATLVGVPPSMVETEETAENLTITLAVLERHLAAAVAGLQAQVRAVIRVWERLAEWL